jgi:hypothetical protein
MDSDPVGPKHVGIRIPNSVSYAVCTADELEREEFYRLKKVQDKKKKIRKEKEALAAERKARGKGEYFATSGFASFAFFVRPLRSIFVRLQFKKFSFRHPEFGIPSPASQSKRWLGSAMPF